MAMADLAGPLTGVSVLLVEDNDDTREAFERLLRLDGAKVVSTDNVRDAIAQAAGRPFDVLITDLGLPDVSGETLIRAVHSQGPRRPRVVVVTGYGEPHQSRALAAGADLVLTKPVPWARLIGALSSGASEPVAA